jgi:hypothetical protein
VGTHGGEKREEVDKKKVDASDRCFLGALQSSAPAVGVAAPAARGKSTCRGRAMSEILGHITFVDLGSQVLSRASPDRIESN